MIAPTTFQLGTFGIAVAGLLLSIRGAWRDYRRDKTRIRVVPKIAYPLGPIADARPRLAFEIVNASLFPITVDEVGFLFRGTKTRGAIPVPITASGVAWPNRLEPL